MISGSILGIAYNVIPVKNAKKSAEWFVSHFGFNIRNDRGNYISLFRDNRTIIDLIESDNDTRAVFEITDGQGGL
ncbi:VOC family protein [Paenibacillus sp. QZ-Y1]|uniref:VOC family protein n=1 Tax=Paenibacillus sp. QZ-Y1 TaxID=3414511 RepID=UPI003F79B1E3